MYNLLKNFLKTKPIYFGMGVPTRTPSYILGYCPKSDVVESDSKSRRKKNY